MTRGPDFGKLVGSDVPEDERERLERVHELLVEAGPPPELSPALEQPPGVGAKVSVLPRRRRPALLLIAAALAAVAFGGGYLTAGHGREASVAFESVRAIEMHGTAGAPGALARIDLGSVDRAGNWPMLVTVQGLPQLPQDGYYELSAYTVARGDTAFVHQHVVDANRDTGAGRQAETGLHQLIREHNRRTQTALAE